MCRKCWGTDPRAARPNKSRRKPKRKIGTLVSNESGASYKDAFSNEHMKTRWYSEKPRPWYPERRDGMGEVFTINILTYETHNRKNRDQGPFKTRRDA